MGIMLFLIESIIDELHFDETFDHDKLNIILILFIFPKYYF